MSPVEAPVKRRYDGARRQEEARVRRKRMLAAAEELFLRQGYAATTVAGVAGASGVSAESVYKAFGGKAGLVRALYERSLDGGPGAVPAPERSDAVAAQDLDARSLLWSWSRFTLEVAPRVSPVMLLVRAAAEGHPEAAGLAGEMNAQRLARMTTNAQRLVGRPGLRAGLTAEEVRDVLYTYTSPELYETLVLTLGWSLQRYADFVYHGLGGQLLDGGPPRA